MISAKLPTMSFRLIKKLFIILVVVPSVFVTGFALGAKYNYNVDQKANSITVSRVTPPDKNLDFSLFWNVWDTLESEYFDKSKIIPANLVYGAIKGMVDAVGDPYTSFLTPSENSVVQEDLQGSFEGVGIQIGFKGTTLAVIAPLPGSPAEAVGIKPGDLIIGIKDEAKGIDRGTVGINLPEAVQDIRGPSGSSVTLALLREGRQDPIIVDVVRQSMKIPSLRLEFVGQDGSIAHVKLLKFGSETTAEWDAAALEILKKQNLKGIIIDVRNNTGGYLQSAVDISSDFLDDRSTVVVEEKANGQKRDYTSTRMARFRNTPVVVLVNGGSASASEILAGALRDEREIKLVGETTFGKGTIQEPIQIEGGSSLHITIARWLTPKGEWVNEEGLDPDVKIIDDPDTKEDEQLLEAEKLIQSI
jgi:carboxyl-terminal processing protease